MLDSQYQIIIVHSFRILSKTTPPITPLPTTKGLHHNTIRFGLVLLFTEIIALYTIVSIPLSVIQTSVDYSFWTCTWVRLVLENLPPSPLSIVWESPELSLLPLPWVPMIRPSPFLFSILSLAVLACPDLGGISGLFQAAGWPNPKSVPFPRPCMPGLASCRYRVSSM